LEAQIVDLADEIAYCHHDLDDGLRSGLITVDQLKSVDLWAEHFEKVKKAGGSDEVVIRQTVRSILNHLVTDLVQTTEKNIADYGIESVEDVRKASRKCVKLSQETDKKNKQLKAFLFQNFYKHFRVERMAAKAETVLEGLFHAYVKNPKILPTSV